MRSLAENWVLCKNRGISAFKNQVRSFLSLTSELQKNLPISDNEIVFILFKDRY